MVEDGLAAVPGRIEVLIGRTDLVVDPRNVPELADHVGIVVGAPELGQRGVFLDGRGILAMVDVGQEGVHLAQVGEGPAAARSGHGPVEAAADEGGGIHAHEHVTLLVERRLVQQIVIEGVGEELQVFRRLEIGFRGELGLRSQCQHLIQIAGYRKNGGDSQ